MKGAKAEIGIMNFKCNLMQYFLVPDFLTFSQCVKLIGPWISRGAERQILGASRVPK